MTDPHPFDELDVETVIDTLRKAADKPRFLSPPERRAVLRRAADLLELDGGEATVYLEDGWTFDQHAPLGDLCHRNFPGKVAEDVDLDTARKIVAASHRIMGEES